eukprot:611908-Prymnesium_polylepis.1
MNIQTFRAETSRTPTPSLLHKNLRSMRRSLLPLPMFTARGARRTARWGRAPWLNAGRPAVHAPTWPEGCAILSASTLSRRCPTTVRFPKRNPGYRPNSPPPSCQ